MSDKISEKWLDWEQLYWLDKKKYPRNDQCYEAGYQAATSDAKALVGELVEVLGDAKATIEYYDRFVDHPDHEQGVDSKPIEAALTKATAWLSVTPPTDKE